MGSSGSEIRAVQKGYSHPDEGMLDRSPSCPKWLWGWVVVYFLLAVLSLLLIGLWVGNNGGTEWGNTSRPNLMFNLHPLFMILGFLVIVGHTNLIYRIWPDANITWTRLAHATLQLTGWILMVIGVYCVGFSKDYSAPGRTGVRAPHFVSAHSWVGLTLLIIMTLQWVCGFFGLLFPGCHGVRRIGYRATHIFTGNVIFFLGCAQVVIGIDQLKPTATTNTLALTVVTYAVLGGYLLTTNLFKRGHAEHPDATTEERQPLAGSEGPMYSTRPQDH